MILPFLIQTQLLQEFYINMTRKIPDPFPRITVRALLSNYFAWQVEINGPATIFLSFILFLISQDSPSGFINLFQAS